MGIHIFMSAKKNTNLSCAVELPGEGEDCCTKAGKCLHDSTIQHILGRCLCTNLLRDEVFRYPDHIAHGASCFLALVDIFYTQAHTTSPPYTSARRVLC